MFPLFDFSLQINSFPMWKAKAELRKILSIPNQEFDAFIENKKQEIVDYHLKNNSSYQKLVGKTNFTTWNDLPIMTKKDFQKPLIERLSTGFSLKNVYVNKTSGSSGDPFIFAKDKFSHALTWANIINRFGWHGIDFNSSYQARFYGIPLDYIGNRKERFKDFLSNRFRFTI
ncbi:MAG: phenylacetate--CoA ligase family protein, partial [Flavobacteriaceae bacterium]|nr:phenylacetate--CoA ligase family protein [Flavobacteriaceae bacterium]